MLYNPRTASERRPPEWQRIDRDLSKRQADDGFIVAGTAPLEKGIVHVRLVSLNDRIHMATMLADHLSTGERVRAARFRFERDRLRFVISRGMLRQFLGDYLDLRPGAVCIRLGSRGKPVLDARISGLHFNLSHSGDSILYAFSRSFQVGVDIERVSRDPIPPSLAARCMTPVELTLWRRLPAHNRRRAFYKMWTRKEAYIKGLGVGMSLEPSEFAVSFRRRQILSGRADHAGRHTGEWTIQELTVGSDFEAAIATEGTPSHLFFSNEQTTTLQDVTV